MNKNVSTLGDGTSWANAYSEFRDALSLAQDCPDILEIWVAEGIYTPTNTENRIIFFTMKNNLAWYGGFDGTENSLEERDWNAHPTILSGDLFGDDDYSTLPPTNNGENSFHVIFNFINGVDSSAILDGFHIVGGNANIDPPNHVGGGLYNKQASPTVANCTFYGNNGGYGGGGNYNDLSTISLDNCIFYNNTGTFRGGGMYSDASEMTLNNCTFFNNHTLTPDSAVGGAMFNNFSNPRITNCSFLNNSSSHGGDAISNNAWSKPFISNSIFWENGDEIVNTSGNPNFDPPEENSNCVVRIQNCIIQNSNGSGSNWNLFYGIDDGENLDADPLFVDEISGNLRLLECSPGVNSGANLLLPQNLFVDLDGNDRIFDLANGGVVDRGAFELQAVPICCTIGTPCDDNDACTTGETLQDDCNCGGGILIDLDEDNICDSDSTDNCIGPNIGDPCDDGNPETETDMINADCICDGVVSDFDLEKGKLSIHTYPNPVDDILFLEIKNASSQNLKIQIFNQLGQLITLKNIDQSNPSLLLFDVKKYKPGLYFIQVKLENRKTENQKFVVF